MEKTKVLIEVRGGVIQNIRSTSPNVEISVADYDNLASDPDGTLFPYYRATADEVVPDATFETKFNQIESIQI